MRVLCLLLLLLLAGFLAADSGQVSREEHADLKARVSNLEHDTREQASITYRNAARLEQLERRMDGADTHDSEHRNEYEELTNKVARLQAVSERNQVLLEGLGVAILAVVGDILVRAFRDGGRSRGRKKSEGTD